MHCRRLRSSFPSAAALCFEDLQGKRRYILGSTFLASHATFLLQRVMISPFPVLSLFPILSTLIPFLPNLCDGECAHKRSKKKKEKKNFGGALATERVLILYS
jgi:hypothetical protein